MKQLKVVLMALVLAGCQTLGLASSPTPAQSVFAAKETFLAAVVVADKYKALPTCTAPMVTIVCKKDSVVVALQKAANAANASLDAAQATVTDPTFAGGDVAQKALLAAQNAVVALTAITSQLGVK
jgi:hypothetical protein